MRDFTYKDDLTLSGLELRRFDVLVIDTACQSLYTSIINCLDNTQKNHTTSIAIANVIDGAFIDYIRSTAVCLEPLTHSFVNTYSCVNPSPPPVYSAIEKLHTIGEEDNENIEKWPLSCFPPAINNASGMFFYGD